MAGCDFWDEGAHDPVGYNDLALYLGLRRFERQRRRIRKRLLLSSLGRIPGRRRADRRYCYRSRDTPGYKLLSF